jgi:hypothetical protein
MLRVVASSQYTSFSDLLVELGQISHDGISPFIFMICFNKTDQLFYWKTGYESISTKLNRSFIALWAPIGTDE